MRCSYLYWTSEGIPLYKNAPMMAMATDSRFVKIVWRLLIILGTLCWLTFWAILTQWYGLVRFSQRNHHTKSGKSSYIYIYIYIYAHENAKILQFHNCWLGRLQVDRMSIDSAWDFLLFPARCCYVATLESCEVVKIYINEGTLTQNNTFLDRNLRIQSQIVNFSAFSVELIVTKPIGDSMHCLLSPG